MFHDLNVAVEPAQREEAARTCARLGFDVIAFNTTVSTRRLTPNEHAPPPLPDLSDATLPHDTGALRVSDGRARGRSHIRVLNRITVVVDEAAQLATLGSPVLESYDLVAVAPGSEKLFQQCLQFDFDIISLRFASKQQFYLKRPQLHVAAEKGIMFEISYASALVDAHSRRFLIGNAVSVSRVTMGKQTILSSGAKTPMVRRYLNPALLACASTNFVLTR